MRVPSTCRNERVQPRDDFPCVDRIAYASRLAQHGVHVRWVASTSTDTCGTGLAGLSSFISTARNVC